MNTKVKITYNIIKSFLLKGLELHLFGSQESGHAGELSDIDFFIEVTQEQQSTFELLLEAHGFTKKADSGYQKEIGYIQTYIQPYLNVEITQITNADLKNEVWKKIRSFIHLVPKGDRKAKVWNAFLKAEMM